MTIPTDLPDVLFAIEDIIASGQSLSGGVGVGSRVIVGIVLPAGWTIANLTFQISWDGGATYKNLYKDDGTEYQVTGTIDAFIAIDGAYFTGVEAIKVRSGTSGAAVNQAASRTITIILRTL